MIPAKMIADMREAICLVSEAKSQTEALYAYEKFSEAVTPERVTRLLDERLSAHRELADVRDMLTGRASNLTREAEGLL